MSPLCFLGKIEVRQSIWGVFLSRMVFSVSDDRLLNEYFSTEFLIQLSGASTRDMNII